MIPIIRNQNNPHPIANDTGDTFDHFFMVITGACPIICCGVVVFHNGRLVVGGRIVGTTPCVVC
jgi:hypothetical protein